MRRQQACTWKTKTLMREIKGNTNRWRETACSWKNQYCQNDHTTQSSLQIHFHAIPIKLPIAFSTELKQKKLQFWNLQKHKRPRTAKAILRKKNVAGGIRPLEFRLNYEATVIKTVWCRHEKQQHRPVEQPYPNPLTYGHQRSRAETAGKTHSPTGAPHL